MKRYKEIKSICLFTGFALLMLSNTFNYFISYKYLQDIELQWSVAMYSIAIELFLFSLYIWLTESMKHGNKLKKILSGWLVIYLLINLIGVCLGFNLHTSGFMLILFITTGLCVAHTIKHLWQDYFL